MSCPERELDLLLSEVECNTAYVSTYHGYEISESTHIINECLDALLYRSGAFRPLTHSTIKLIEEATPRIGEANALFLEGARMYFFDCVSFMLFAQAEEKGCKHPVLYYFMGECYRDGEKGAAKNVTMALEYYQQAIAGGCSWGLVGRHHLLRLSDYCKALHNLLDLEREGHIDGYIFNVIARHSSRDRSSSAGQSMVRVYYQRAIDYGYPYAAVNQANCLDSSRHGNRSHSLVDKNVLFLVEADNRTIGTKDDRILKKAIEVVIHSGSGLLCTFKNKSELALHYCDVLIQRRSPLGYQMKAEIYAYGFDEIGQDESKAVAIREEADRLGLADYDMYNALQRAYSKGDGVPVNGLKVLEYCEKALQVVETDSCIETIYQMMASVYKEGIEPVKKDGRKVVDCYERALRSTTSSLVGVSFLKKLADVYVKGLAPVPPNGAKALECYIKALEHVGENQSNIYIDMAEIRMEGRHSVPPKGAKALGHYMKAFSYGLEGYQSVICSGMASVYETGVPPIAPNLDIADDLRRMRRRCE